MSNSTTELALRKLVKALRTRAQTDAVSAASGAVSHLENSIDDSVAAHAAQTQHVHGVGDYYVAKSSSPTQFPNWADIQNKPDFLADPISTEPDDDEHLTPFIDFAWLPVADSGETASDKLVRADDPRLSDRPQTMNTAEPIGAGLYVCVFDDGGVARITAAHANDTNHAAMAFIIDSVGYHEDADAYFDGVNAIAQLTTTPAAADVGKTVFLSTTPGYVSLTPPSDPGQLLQPVGRIIKVVSGTTVEVLTVFETQFYL
ncbi:hypothetical protein SE17_12440 [Kouleothrix aurantiaca]|uniref:Uncharacterized protein n=1 Tax=Kouleothrix aurantiaca TaxID=186479 RepID=A0A0P9D4Z3_9CHLR|nr:hypothetical protein SE17_12440 [Kouleothrix aurantiaca]